MPSATIPCASSRRPFAACLARLGLASMAMLAAAVPGHAQPGCLSANVSGTTVNKLINGTWAIEVSSPFALSVSGFSMPTQCLAGGCPLTLPTALFFEASPGGPPQANPVVESTMKVDLGLKFYSTVFPQPVSISAGQRFFIAFTVPVEAGPQHELLAPTAPSPPFPPTPHYVRPGDGFPWGGPNLTMAWNWQVDCLVSCGQPAMDLQYGAGKPGSNGVPVLSGVLPPVVGATTSIRLTGGNPFVCPLLFIGTKSASLPFDGGHLLVGSPLVWPVPFPIALDGTLVLSGSTPNDAALCGVTLYNQMMFLDPAAGGFYHTAQTNGLARTFGS